MSKKINSVIMKISNHPCFDDKARHKYGRIHLPVASKCNIQCNFCDRQYDCLNESRPGVTSVILSPHQALAYLKKVFALRKDISVAGIAGPGDPFANPEETMETLRLIRKAYPDLLLCVATNGLNLFPYLDELAKLKVSHISITMNAVDPLIGEKIYAWVRDGTKIYRGKEAAEVLLCRQLEGLIGIKEHKIMAKINTIIIPGVNEGHIGEISRKVAVAGADIMNLIPLYPVIGTAFENISVPTAGLIDNCRNDAARFMPIMNHCTRCRSDAVGLLGEDLSRENISLLQSCASLPFNPKENRPYVACASREGTLVNMHLGQTEKLYIYGKDGDVYKLIAVRKISENGNSEKKWLNMSGMLNDCWVVLVEAAGRAPREALGKQGIKVITLPGLIETGLEAIYSSNYVSGSAALRRCECAKFDLKPNRSLDCGCQRGGGCG
jgi:nitrogen fixation protein NifB